MADDVVTYRQPSAQPVLWTGVIVLGLVVVAALLVPSRDLPPLIPVVLLGAWLAAVLWTWPRLQLTHTHIEVRNSFHTVIIPLATIAEVTGGRRLMIRTHLNRAYVPAAVPGGGVFLWGAIRQANTYGSSPVPVMRVDRLRIDSEHEQSPSVIVARTIRRRIDQLSAEARLEWQNPDGTARDVPPPRPNVDVIVSSIVMIAVCALLFVVLM